MKTKRFSPKKKDRIKIIRGTLQGIVLLVLLIVILKAVFTFSQYKPYDYNDLTSNEDNGFIAVSYFGVDRAGSDTLISTESLEKQLKALKDNGYVTITQQDILDYYNEGRNYRIKHYSCYMKMVEGILLFSHKRLWKNIITRLLCLHMLINLKK